MRAAGGSIGSAAGGRRGGGCWLSGAREQAGAAAEATAAVAEAEAAAGTSVRAVVVPFARHIARACAGRGGRRTD
jgi:hypothetical protein